MATNLPTLTLPDAQATRVLDAFKAQVSTTTTAETARADKRWLADQVRAVVLAYEAGKLDEANTASKRAALAALETELPKADDIV